MGKLWEHSNIKLRLYYREENFYLSFVLCNLLFYIFLKVYYKKCWFNNYNLNLFYYIINFVKYHCVRKEEEVKYHSSCL